MHTIFDWQLPRMDWRLRKVAITRATCAEHVQIDGSDAAGCEEPLAEGDDTDDEDTSEGEEY